VRSATTRRWPSPPAARSRADELPDRFDAVSTRAARRDRSGVLARDTSASRTSHRTRRLRRPRVLRGARRAHRGRAGATSRAPELTPLRVLDEFKGPAYGRAEPEQINFIRTIARATGLVLDPVYSGKALFACAQADQAAPSTVHPHAASRTGSPNTRSSCEQALFLCARRGERLRSSCTRIVAVDARDRVRSSRRRCQAVLSKRSVLVRPAAWREADGATDQAVRHDDERALQRSARPRSARTPVHARVEAPPASRSAA